MNKTKRILIKLVMFFMIILAGSYCFLAYGAYFSFDTSQREIAIAAVTSSPNLPDDFVKLYMATHPGLEESFRRTFASKVFGDESDCPCQDAAADLAVKMASGKIYKIAQLTFFLEEYVTQRQCLEFSLNNTVFAYNTNNIQEATRYYYNKELENLNDDEMLELIAMSKNPYFFNKKNHPKRLAKQVERLREKMKN
ncbi:transglycosylase domain-containing protein [Flavobacterium sp. DGU11]|uniref:Transglycosylase domain-containing protein n=1 Tax=Flavobacterium arundinis TaxID=3139143 RepID=A0ABU9HUV0_9FLAO